MVAEDQPAKAVLQANGTAGNRAAADPAAKVNWGLILLNRERGL